MDARGIGGTGARKPSKAKIAQSAAGVGAADVDCPRGEGAKKRRESAEEHLTKQSKMENICTIQTIETQGIDYALQVARFLFCSKEFRWSYKSCLRVVSGSRV